MKYLFILGLLIMLPFVNAEETGLQVIERLTLEHGCDPQTHRWDITVEDCVKRCHTFLKWNGSECIDRCEVESNTFWNNTLQRCVSLFPEEPIIVKIKEWNNPIKNGMLRFFDWFATIVGIKD